MPTSSSPPTHPKLQSLLAHWERRRGALGVPNRSSFDPLEMREWLGNVAIIQVTEDGDYAYRLYGTNFVFSFGQEMTGRRVSSLPPEQQDVLRSEYGRVVETRTPLSRIYTAVFDVPTLTRSEEPLRRQATWERLVLPLTSNGTQVDLLMVAAYRLET